AARARPRDRAHRAEAAAHGGDAGRARLRARRRAHLGAHQVAGASRASRGRGVKLVRVPDRARALERREHPIARVLGVLGLLVLWEALTRTGWVPALFLPSPLGVLAAGVDMLRTGELLTHLVTSLGRILLGFGLGALGGVSVGLAVGVFSLAEAVGNPLIAATFPIPKIALLPLLILWLGIGEASKVAVIMLGVFFPMAINTYTGVRHADSQLLRAAVSFGAGRWSLIRKVMLPSALPMIFAG